MIVCSSPEGFIEKQYETSTVFTISCLCYHYANGCSERDVCGAVVDQLTSHWMHSCLSHLLSLINQRMVGRGRATRMTTTHTPHKSMTPVRACPACLSTQQVNNYHGVEFIWYVSISAPTYMSHHVSLLFFIFMRMTRLASCSFSISSCFSVCCLVSSALLAK